MAGHSCLCCHLCYLGVHLCCYSLCYWGYSSLSYVGSSLSGSWAYSLSVANGERRKTSRFHFIQQKCYLRDTDAGRWHGICCVGRTILIQQPCSHYCHCRAFLVYTP